jgi:hypothetical protein
MKTGKPHFCPVHNIRFDNKIERRLIQRKLLYSGATMDPCRIRSYLQVACAGLGFEIGEIWWTSNEHGTSTVAAIGKQGERGGGVH